MNAALADLSLNISQKRWACVLDPTLALSVYGLPLLTRLGKTMEIWVARELWHILDDTDYYIGHPEMLLVNNGQGNQAEREKEIVQTLLDWERVRLDNDPSRLYCYWIGDSPLESFLPENSEPDIILHYEALSAELDSRLRDEKSPSLCDKESPLLAAWRDTAALAACLPAAFVLTQLPPSGTEKSCPAICQSLGNGDIHCNEVTADDSWQKQESDFLRQILIRTGLSKWAWFGLRLAVLHIAAPAACIVDTQKLDKPVDYGLNETAILANESAIDYWREARGFWYSL